MTFGFQLYKVDLYQSSLLGFVMLHAHIVHSLCHYLSHHPGLIQRGHCLAGRLQGGREGRKRWDSSGILELPLALNIIKGFIELHR